MIKRFGLSFLLWLVIGLAAVAAPSFDVSVSSHQIQERDTLRLILSFKQEADPYGSMISVPEIVVPPLLDFEILGRQTATSTVSVAGKMQMSTETIYQLKPLRSGNLEIPALTVPYQEGGQNKEIHSTPIVIEVSGAGSNTTIPTDQPVAVDNQASDAPAAEAAPSALRQGFIYAAIALVIGGCFYLLIYLILFLRRRQPLRSVTKTAKPLVTTSAPAITPAIATPSRGFEASAPPQDILEDLHKQVRQRLDEQRLLPYPGASTEEIIIFLQAHKLPAPEIEAVIAFLKKTQSLRFQAAPPSRAELEQLLDLAEKFIRSH